jgi:hypothetical protein
MRRYKIVACILLTLSVFSFVLAAPVPVRGIRKACAYAVDGGDKVIIGSGKRSEEEKQPSSSLDWRSTPSQHQGSSSFFSGESTPRLLSTSGGTEQSWNPEGKAKFIQPGTSTELQPTSSSKAKSVSWASSKEVKLPSGEIISEPLVKPKSVSWAPSKEMKLPSGEIISEPLVKPPKSVSWAPSKEAKLPSGEIISEPLVKPKSVSWAPSKEVKLPSGEIISEPLPPETKPIQPKPKSNNIFRKLGKLKFWRRIPALLRLLVL